MTDHITDWNRVFYRNLTALTDSTFPKRCTSCGKIYETQADFMVDTMPVRDTSLQQGSGLIALDPEDHETVSVFRNCTCGSTLMADFRSRRDNSAQGRERRCRFDELLTMLIHRGMTHQTARVELLHVLGGKPSRPIAEVLGPDAHKLAGTLDAATPIAARA